MTTNVFSRITELDPAREPEATPDWDTLAPVLLSFLDERTMPMPTQTPQKVQQDQSKGRRGWLVAVAAFAVVVVFGLTAALLSSRSTDTETAAGADDNPALTVDGALAVSDEFIEAFNAGDADAVLALLTSDVALSERYTDEGPSFEALDPAFFEQHLAWSTAQGTTFTSPECVVTDEGTAAAVTVSCEFGWLNAAKAAVGLSPVPTVLTMVVTRSGISQAAFEYPGEFGVGDFGAGSDGRGHFDTWLVANHADDMEGIGYGEWDSVAVAEQGGILLALYVEEWAAFLETRG
jgi:ketosteroid isomerase-like protein